MKTIKLKNKVKNIFPYGNVLVPIIPKTKNKVEGASTGAERVFDNWFKRNMKPKRQALVTTLAELTKLKLDLIKETQFHQKNLGIKDWKVVNYNDKVLFPIINKKGLSDTWEFE